MTKEHIVRDTIQNTEFGLLDTIGQNKLLKFIKLEKPTNLMTLEEENELFLLPKKIKIYRGISSDEKINFNKYGYGINWTTNIDTALWFANCRGGSFKSLITASIESKNIICLWLDKGEYEIVLNPDDIILNNLNIKKWKEEK